MISACAETHNQAFEVIYAGLSPSFRKTIDELLHVPLGEQHTYFHQLKAYPPAAKISSLKTYLGRYKKLSELNLDTIKPLITPSFQRYLFELSKKYDAREIKRFKDHKRYALMCCFLLESRKTLLDHLVKMHEQYIIEINRRSKNTYERQHRGLRKQHKRAVDNILQTTSRLLEWPDDKPLSQADFWQHTDKQQLHESLQNLHAFKRLEEQGYADILLTRYSSFRKYFAQFIHLPFAAEHGNTELIEAIQLLRELDNGTIEQLPADTPATFVPKALEKVLREPSGNLNRSAWEMGLAFAIKDGLRSGDLYIPQSRQHVSFWDLMLNDAQWKQSKEASYIDLGQPQPNEAKDILSNYVHEGVSQAIAQFEQDDFATISGEKFKLKRDDKLIVPAAVARLQKVIDTGLETIRIEQLLLEVDVETGFSRHFVPIQGHRARPKQFYKTLMAGLISQATNLGVLTMSASMKGVSVDMLRHILNFYIREETIRTASTALVDAHHQLPLSSRYGTGEFSSSDAQRFGIRASSLMASYYPRYYGYYQKAVGIYTHVSDQYSVFNTRVISCSPREALYVLDGLLENNSQLSIKRHTTDTHGYTEIIFALCYLLGYEFMPRIRDLKDQQLYRIDKTVDYGPFAPLMTRSANVDLVVEQWDAMARVTHSLKQKTAPAHLIVQRLTNSYPSDRLAKAFTHLGRIIKTQYILRYITDPALRRTVHIQLNKGEYRHNLPRRIFFANQGEFTTGNYESIMNKASCLSLVSNAILFWNTRKIHAIIETLKQEGETIEDETLAHISLLPYKHVIPNGTYFIE